MGILLVGSVLFLGYSIYKKINNPGWAPFRATQSVNIEPQAMQIGQITKQPWPAYCLEGEKTMVTINPQRIAIANPNCDFIDIYNENGQFINRIELGGE